jgi:anti-sigma regulatory factor (Ser/Thr protein kinase)
MKVATRRSARLDTEPTAAANARSHARAACAGVTSADLADDVTLVVSELVTNAVRHGRGEIRLDLQVDRAEVRVSVRDAGRPFHWDREPAHAGALTGRGLEIVSALATDFGVRDVSDTGKSVWCVVHEAVPR